MKNLEALALTFLVLTSACLQPEPACGPATCPSGCCDASQTCRDGVGSSACGHSGLSCDVCVGAQQCQVGTCIGSAVAGGGSSGGGTIAGGGTAVGGGTGTGGGNVCTAESDSDFCAGLSRECGGATGVDRCGSTRQVASCGTCSIGSTCETSGHCSCTPETDQALCQTRGFNCGAVTLLDRCGTARSVVCGNCTSPLNCGGSGVANVCGQANCTAETDAVFCSRLGKACGSTSGTDNCGHARTVSSCGSCATPTTCNVGACSCTAETNSQYCARLGATCGTQTANDNCGQPRAVNCGSCTSPQTCGGSGSPKTCGCTSESSAALCQRLGKTCGQVTAIDSCGQTRSLACGTCTLPQTCSANVCSCSAESDQAFCSRLGHSCGALTGTDNCGMPRTVADCGGTHACPIAGDTSCSGGVVKTCATAANFCRVWGPTSTCPGGFCSSVTSCGSCTNTCTAGATQQCLNGSQQTCTTDSNGCRAWSAATSCPQGCRNALICEPCAHECTAWGSSCAAGNVLETCVTDSQGCRKKLTQTCSFSCAAGACATCSSVFPKMMSTASNDQQAWFKEIVVQGTTALTAWAQRRDVYTLEDGGLTSFDVSNPNAISKANTINLFPGRYYAEPRNLHWQGNRLYFTNPLGLQVYDTSASLAPTPLVTYPVGDGGLPAIYGLSVNGTRGCMALADEVTILDFSTTLPTRVGGIPYFAAAECVGSYAALINSGRIQIWNIAAPTNPQLVAETLVASYGLMSFDGTSVVVQKSLGTNRSQLEVWTFVPPATLTLASTTVFPGSANGFNDNQATFAGDKIVGTVEILPGGQGRLKKVIPFAPGARASTISGNRLYAANDGVTVFNLDQVSDVRQIALPTNSDLIQAVMRGSLAYICRRSGFSIQDMRVPQNRVVLSSVATPCVGVQLVGATAWVASVGSGTMVLTSYDVTNPWQPRLLNAGTFYPANGSQRYFARFTIDGTRAYAACDTQSVCVFDVSTSTPTLLGRLPATASSNYAEFAGGYIAMPYPTGLSIGDGRSPSTFPTVATLAFPGDPPGSGGYDIAIANNTAYVTRECPAYIGNAWDICLEIIDLSVPTAPVQRATLPFAHPYKTADYQAYRGGESVRVEGRWVYVAHSKGGVTVIDVQNPSAPVIVQEMWTAGNGGYGFSSDRWVTTFTADAPVTFNGDQVTEMCR